MPLLGALHTGSMALEAQRLAMEVSGNNIANANTPGYARQRPIMNPAAINELRPGVHLGMGVTVEGIESAIDVFVEQRLRNSTSDRTGQSIQEQSLLRMEAIFNEMGGDDLSTILTEFFNTIQDLQNRPEDASIRTLVVQQGRMVTNHIQFLRDRLGELRTSANGQVGQVADQINRLTMKIADLNVQIVQLEGGGEFRGAAGGLRTERRNLLTELSELVQISVYEDDSGLVNVHAGSDYLVYGKSYRQVEEQWTDDEHGPVVNLSFAGDQGPLQPVGGKLGGYTTTRDETVVAYVDLLDQLAGALVFEFNKVYSQGRGMEGYRDLVGTSIVTDSTVALDDQASGLEFLPRNGSFNVRVTNANTGLVTTANIQVDLDGLGGNDTTATDLVGALDAVDGITAVLTPEGRVRITGDAAELTFTFSNDTSYALAALGINTFFTGSQASDVGINQAVLDQPKLFAAALDDSAGNVDNAVALVALQDAPVGSLDSVALPKFLEQIIEQMAGESSLAQVESKSLENFHQTLVAEREQYSGVSLDEEAILLVNYQHSFVAATRLITTVSQMLDALMRM